ncbi:hypothetical protein [Kaistia soli]|uniref:hypothetical protein n=1 Tax=Kaistia soli TaxID=446684 RepID=UPI000933C1FD|nr:hypothetical protein [Kaistia soli]
MGNTLSGVTSVTGGLAGNRNLSGSNSSTATSAPMPHGPGGARSGGSNPLAVLLTPKSTLLGGIDARLDVLSRRELVRLCVDVGGGSGCGGSRQRLSELVDARVKLLSKQQLATVCVNIGASCGSVGGARVNAAAVNREGVLSADARSNLINGIRAKANVLSKGDVVKLCATAGGGAGCSTGSRNQAVRLLDTRLAALSPRRLLDLCLKVGGSCGTSGTVIGTGPQPATGMHPGNGNSAHPGIPHTRQGTRVLASVLDRNGVLSAKARSNLVGGIRAKANVLAKGDVAKLCLTAGGGSGCGSGSRSQTMQLLDTRLAVLSPSSLVDLCLSVGGSCGSGAGGNGGGTNPGGGTTTPGGTIPGTTVNNGGDSTVPAGNGNNSGIGVANNNNGNGKGNGLAPTRPGTMGGNLPNRGIALADSSMSDKDGRLARKRCSTILINPAMYDEELIKLCRMIRQP